MFYASAKNVLNQQFLSMVRDSDDVLDYKIVVDEKKIKPETKHLI